MNERDDLPILIGVGQHTVHWDGANAAQAPDPVGLCVDAAEKAFEDATTSAALRALIDAVVVVRTYADSIPGHEPETGRCANPPGTVAERLGVSPSTAVYSIAGGDQPQALVNEFSARLYRGEHQAVLLCGAEATAAAKTARRAHFLLDWSQSEAGDFEDRGLGPMLLTDYEIKNGLGWPAQTYPLFEQAYRSRCGSSSQEHLDNMAEQLSQFSLIAQSNPYAQFPTALAAEFLKTESKENFPIASPYLKWHVAQEAVNQGAALILTTVSRARELGVPETKWIYLHGHSALKDRPITERPDLSRSQSLKWSLDQALETSARTADSVAFFDIYSCFPCVVFLAAESLGLNWRSTPLTVTGGLPFFGGPGNNYSMHAIAAMVEALRTQPGEFGLVLANGGFLSKHAVGVYSTQSPKAWSPVDSSELQVRLDETMGPIGVTVTEETLAEVESFTVIHGRNGGERGLLALRSEAGRIFAQTGFQEGATVHDLAKSARVIGKRARAQEINGSNFVICNLPTDDDPLFPKPES
ncbi:MAG: acetyl-CoA acetyltransferase [Pseudomonadota bacterium]